MIDAALILVVSIVVVLLNLLLLDRVSRELSHIDEVRGHKLQLLRKMKDVVRERSIVMLDMAADEDVWLRDEKFMEFQELAVDFIVAREQLVAIGLETSEEAALRVILKDIQETEKIQDDIVLRLHGGVTAGIYDDIARHDLALEFNLLSKMDAFYEQVIENSNRQRITAREIYQSLGIISGAISFVFILTIILLMARSLNRIKKIEMRLVERAESLGWDATHDPLTNVYNRRWLEYKIGFYGDAGYSNEVEHSLLYLDLDGFKQINDNHGHNAGDNYLISFCREVEHAIRQNDTFCRMGGDEFAILLEHCKADFATKIANELLQRIRGFTVEFEGKLLATSCSIGVCQFRGNEVTFDALVQRADELCYQAKGKGKNQIIAGDYAVGGTPAAQEK